MKKQLSMMAAVLCAVMMVGSLSVTAYAGGGDEYIEPTEQWRGLILWKKHLPLPLSRERASPKMENLVTRDLLYDKHTNKQFITVQTSGGNTFLYRHRLRQASERGGRTVSAYFFSVVDEADLLAAAEAAGVELPACECTEKCAVGAINTDCPVCAVNMSECVGNGA